MGPLTIHSEPKFVKLQSVLMPTSRRILASRSRPVGASLFGALVVIIVLGFVGCDAPPIEGDAFVWRKGNLHTHSLWSDGDHFPEAVAAWYRDNGYSFLAISDHNTIAETEKWIDVSPGARHERAYKSLVDRFGDSAAQRKDSLGLRFARLSTFDAYRDLLEVPDEFLMIRAEEVSDKFGSLPIHINATNIQELVEPQGGESVRDVMQRNLDVIAEQRRTSGQRIVPHINHPNFYWGISAADLAFITGDKFFEVYNGHPMVRNEGDSTHYSTEEIWDYVLAVRLSEGMDVMYGLATDDTHHYFDEGATFANAGRGWVVVRANELGTESILRSLEEGEFYSSSGVNLASISFDGKRYEFSIEAEPGVSYKTEFVVSSRLPIGHEISLSAMPEGIGRVVAVDSSLTPGFELSGGELYVRARVTSTKLKSNPYVEGEFERAWLQPVMPR